MICCELPLKKIKRKKKQIKILNNEGIKVISSIFFNPELSLKRGNYSKFKPNKVDIISIKKGKAYFKKTKSFMKEHPDELQEFLEILSNACYEYLKQQVLSGVNALQIFDSWADLLSDKDLEDFSLRYTRLLTNQLKADPVTSNIPIILFEKAPKKKITDLIFRDISCISLYWQEDIESIAEDLKNKYAVQGNLSPNVLLGSDELIWNETQKICTIMNEYPGFIFNLGHGITPDIKPEKVKVMIDAIRK